MDVSGFIEKCRVCGGNVVMVKKTKTFSCLGQFKNSGKEKQCSKCRQFLKEEDIVSTKPGEILGWAPI